MRLVLFSDLHSHAYREFAKTLPNGRNSRLENALYVLREVREAAKRENAPVVFLGDLFHKRNIFHTAVYNAVYEEIRLFKEQGVKLVLIVGNHDQATADGKIHSLEPMKDIADVVDVPRCIAIGDTRIQCVPYMEDVKALRAAIADVPAGKTGKCGPRLLACHAGLAGAVTGPVEYRPDESLEVSAVPDKYDFAFFGHYHKRQKMKDQCWYAGSPMQQSRGESEEHEKGYLLFDTDTNKIRNVPLGMPEFVTVDAKKWTDEEVGCNYVDVVGEDSKELEVAADRITAVGAAGVLPVLLATPVTSNPKAKRLDVDPSMDYGTMLKKYVKQYAPDDIDADLVTKEAAALLEKVS